MFQIINFHKKIKFSFLQHISYAKYSCRVGGSRSKDVAVLMPYKQLKAFCRSAETMYIFPMLLIPILRFFLKSTNLKYSMISPNNHSTNTLTELIEPFYAFIKGVRWGFRNGP